MFPSVFDVAGTESDWQSGGTPGKEHGFSPPPAVDLLFARAMSGAKPYLHLLDTHLATWTKEFTNQYRFCDINSTGHASALSSRNDWDFTVHHRPHNYF
jgi:hypothetical protein